MAVNCSKKVGSAPVSACTSSDAARTRDAARANSPREISSPPTRTRSVIETRCGEV
jgi:hypothetical protein